jgi:hypothetical protein
MARRQLLGIKERVETYGVRSLDPDHPETGRPDQYQSFVIIYASGQIAGVQGLEKISLWRQMALADKIMVNSGEEKPGTFHTE